MGELERLRMHACACAKLTYFHLYLLHSCVAKRPETRLRNERKKQTFSAPLHSMMVVLAYPLFPPEAARGGGNGNGNDALECSQPNHAYVELN